MLSDTRLKNMIENFSSKMQFSALDASKPEQSVVEKNEANVDKYIFEMVASFSLCHELLQMELFSQQD